MHQLDSWFQHGVQLLKDNPESGIAFFKIESNTSESLLETLSSSLELDRVKGVVRLYCSALSGSTIEVLNTQELVNKNIGRVDEDQASTDGTKVFLPPVVDHYQDKTANFAWFKVVATHQVGHLEFGSFEFVFDRTATQFEEERRFELEKQLAARRATNTDTHVNQKLYQSLLQGQVLNLRTLGQGFLLHQSRRTADSRVLNFDAVIQPAVL